MAQAVLSFAAMVNGWTKAAQAKGLQYKSIKFENTQARSACGKLRGKIPFMPRPKHFVER
ncbi:hypothetical protein [Rhizobium paknamense]|uniref:Uncharacterized protein n=1 Tax=Rhizobium paknamense TaxID=1206817 RepID=A0ABU0I9Z2_9HYPH|nr:hypothetical protein [Rhizobium paknamense]MDQ0454044.1 hypothetical protein [Rhizobium paknamense]